MTTNLDQLNISEILTQADNAKDKFITAQKEFYSILGYLDRTKRYKEDAQYKDANFDTFLRTRYNMTQKTYIETKIVLFDFSEAASSHGVGFVRKVIKQAGRSKAQAVFGEIDTHQQKKKMPLKVQDKERILEKHVLPTPAVSKREQPRHDWEFAFKQENRRAEKLNAELEDLRDQNQKLLARNKELSDMLTLLQEELEAKDKQVRMMRKSSGYLLPAQSNYAHRPTA